MDGRRIDRLPSFIRDLDARPGAVRTLIVAAVAAGAAGLNPPVTWPGNPGVQSAIRAQPQINNLVLGVTVVAAGLLFVGGVIVDTNGRRRILLVSLATLTITSLVGLVLPPGTLFALSRVVAAAAMTAVLPFSLALIVTTYAGMTRPTAIGIVYAAWGGAMAVSPVLFTILGPAGPYWPSFVASALASAGALWFVRTRVPDLSHVTRADRPYVIATAVWAFAVVMISAGIVNFSGSTSYPLRIALIVTGLAMLVGWGIWSMRRRDADRLRALRVERRPVTVAIAVGVIFGFAQAAPLFQLPLFFNLILRFGPFWGIVATAPFIVALVVAGPIAGALLARFRPRTLVAGGLAFVGLGNVASALVLGRDAAYAFFILPLAMIGAGFVVGTTVRTAIIFASVSRSVPGTAAALNEASILVGSRIGLAALTALITQRATEIFAASLGPLDATTVAREVDVFQSVLVAIGTPNLSQIVGTIAPETLASYIRAFVEAYRESLLLTGGLALVAAPLAWLGLGARDPLATMWDHRDEREERATAPTT